MLILSAMKHTTISCLQTLCAAALLLCGCTGAPAVHLSGEEAYAPRHAEGYSIYATDGASTVIELRNPWQGGDSVRTQLFVSRGGELPPDGFDGVTVAAPVRQAVCFSSTHVAFLDALEATQIIQGVSGAGYISNEKVRERYRRGDLRDVGYDSNVNYELLTALRPDIVFVYGVGGENNTLTDKFRELHIPFVYIGEYMETTPLGKAEWLIPFGELIDRREEAAALFAGIERRYDSLRTKAAAMVGRPSVMLNAPYRDVWFVPGDRSYMVRLIADAGGSYVFAGEESTVSRPVNGEAAWRAARRADVWLTPNQARSIDQLKAQNPKFTEIPCVAARRVYNCTRRSTPEGGSDFWESGALYADRVLRDILLCLHPEAAVAGEEEMYYFERLE